MIDEQTVREGLTAIFADVFMRDDIAVDPALTASERDGQRLLCLHFLHAYLDNDCPFSCLWGCPTRLTDKIAHS